MLVSEAETVPSEKSHTQQLAPSSLSLPFPQSLHEPPLKETSIPSPNSHQNSILSLTLDEIQIKSRRMFGSMSMDEFLANIWNSDGNQVDSQAPLPPPPIYEEFPFEIKNAGEETEPVISLHDSLSVPPPICKKTVDEVWTEIRKVHRRPHQQNEEAANNNDKISGSEGLKRKKTLGEMTLEDFLIKAGVVQPSSSPLPFQIPTGNMTGNGPFGGCYEMGPAMGMGFSAQQNVLLQGHSLAGKEACANSAGEKCGQAPGESSRNGSKKRIIDGLTEVVVERRQRRMLKNRESAARSRARRQAYTAELEASLGQLKQENEKLKEILAEAEQKRKQEIWWTKHACKGQKRTNRFRGIRRTMSTAW